MVRFYGHGRVKLTQAPLHHIAGANPPGCIKHAPSNLGWSHKSQHQFHHRSFQYLIPALDLPFCIRCMHSLSHREHKRDLFFPFHGPSMALVIPKINPSYVLCCPQNLHTILINHNSSTKCCIQSTEIRIQSIPYLASPNFNWPRIYFVKVLHSG